MKHVMIFVFIVFFFSAVAQTAVEPFISFPMASNLAVSADGQKLAWLYNDRGARNIFVRMNGQNKQLTNYPDDDGQEISEINFTSDGSTLLYVRGGAPNTSGESPNPASLATAPDRSIWMIPVTGGEPSRITKGSGYVLSKDPATGAEVMLLTRGGQIHQCEIKKEANPQQLFFARGGNYSPTPSPDGKELLFVSNRGDHSFIGVYNYSLKKVRWIQPDVTRDQLPVWSPDGQRIAFIRTPGQRAEELPNLMAGKKFSIVVATADGQTATVIWTSPGLDGGHNLGYPETPFAWHKSGRIVFYSEHTGWMHIWSVNSDGSDLRDLTPGNGEVESYSADADGKTLWFDTNINDIDRRHIWKTDVVKGTATQVTFGEGIEMYPQTIGKDLYCLRATFNTAMALVKADASGKNFTELTTPNNSVFDSKVFLKPEQVIFTAPDGLKIHGQLFIDRSIKGKRPAIVFMHGGPTRQMLLGFHYSDYYSQSYAFNQHLARKGYVVLSVNFRNGIGYGKEFRMSPNQGPRGAVEYQDIVAAGKYLQGLAEVNAEKIGLWGGSYGGYLTAMGLARNPELFKAGVDVHGVHDWAFRAREFWTKGGWWGIGEKDFALAVSSSPVADLSKWKAPVLLVSGDDDRNVMFQETTDLAERLKEKNVPVEVLVLPDEVHGFLRYESWRSIFNRSTAFFDRNLKP